MTVRVSYTTPDGAEHELLANEMSYSVEQETTDLRSWNGQSIRTDIGRQQVNVELHDVRESNTDYPRNQLWGECMTENNKTSDLLQARLSVMALNMELAGAYANQGRIEMAEGVKERANTQQSAIIEWVDGLLSADDTPDQVITNTFNQPLDIEDVKQAVAEVFAEHELQMETVTEVTIEDDEEEGGEPERRGEVITYEQIQVGDVLDVYDDSEFLDRHLKGVVVQEPREDDPSFYPLHHKGGGTTGWGIPSGSSYKEIRLVERPEKRRGEVIASRDLEVGDIIDIHYRLGNVVRGESVIKNALGDVETDNLIFTHVGADGDGRELRLVERPVTAEPETAANERRGVRITNIDQVNDGDLVDLYYGTPSQTDTPSESGEPIAFEGFSVRIGGYTFLKSEIYDSVRHVYLVEKAKPSSVVGSVEIKVKPSRLTDQSLLPTTKGSEIRVFKTNAYGTDPHETEEGVVLTHDGSTLPWGTPSGVSLSELHRIEEALGTTWFYPNQIIEFEVVTDTGKADVLTDQDDLPEYSGSKIRVLKFNRYGEDEVVDQVREHDGDTAEQWRSDEGETPLYLDSEDILEFEVLYDASDDIDFNY